MILVVMMDSARPPQFPSFTSETVQAQLQALQARALRLVDVRVIVSIIFSAVVSLTSSSVCLVLGCAKRQLSDESGGALCAGERDFVDSVEAGVVSCI